MIAKSHHWQERAIALAAVAFFGLWGSNAAALSLGRISVQSALGEPLRAEIDVPDISADEAASLKASVALPDAFRGAGLEYNPAIAGVQVTLQKRADGRAYIRLSGNRAINEPFVDLILEASWATGRIVRDYTMLFDPPNPRQAAPVAPTLAQVPAQPSTVAAPSRPSLLPLPAQALPAPRTIEPRQNRNKKALAGPGAAVAQRRAAGQVTVRAGDTASKIAAATRPANVSLDQMLVGLLRTNPHAFMDDNVNRIKAGSVMNVPTAEQAAATPAVEATQIISAQSRNFNDFRRKLAGSAPSISVASATQKASGSVQARIEDKVPLTAVPDKLTLSKGALPGQPGEDQLAKERSASEAAARAAEISKNINDLNKLGASTSAALPASAPAQAASAPASAAKPAVAAVAQRPAASSPASAEPAWFDGLLENPVAPASAAGLIALLAGLWFFQGRRRRKEPDSDSVFLESRIRPDSFFGANGGQSVDTKDSVATGSSMAYSPSELNSVNDVDPVAEADVYLAYGRDLQAEEILKDALHSDPGRIAIHQKLLEIFARRRDTKGFEDMAGLAFKLTKGEGLDWERIRKLGLGLDPKNAWYQPNGRPNNAEGNPSTQSPPDDVSSFSGHTIPMATQASEQQTVGSVDLDLELDFSLDDKSVVAIDEATPTAALTNTVEFSLPDQAATNDDLTTPPAGSEIVGPEVATDSGRVRPPPVATAETVAPAAPDFGMLQFDLGSLSLDLEDAPKTVAPDTSDSPDTLQDHLSTKLELADEFKAMGDKSGARTLLEEVISEASGDIKKRAQRALSEL